jgi:hypothetical protein
MPEARLHLRRAPLMALAMLALLAALWAALVRLGWGLPYIRPDFALAHGPLMVCGFLGTLISLERAVALDHRAAYLAPLLTGLGSLLLIVGIGKAVGPALIVLGSMALVLVFAAIIERQTAPFTITMGLGALAWFVGNGLWLDGVAITEMFFWWAAFLVLTIVGERLELSRMRGPSQRSRREFLLSLALYLAGIALTFRDYDTGLRLIGAGMIAFAVWLFRYDVARRTVHQSGLTRFIAVSLLSGYAWLGIGGGLWLWSPDTANLLQYDAMLHSLFLGFIFSMIFAHAPIIFPAVLGGALPYNRAFYAHLLLLHLSLLLRVGGDLFDSFAPYQWGGMLNAAALLIFVANTAAAAMRGASTHRSRREAGAAGAALRS